MIFHEVWIESTHIETNSKDASTLEDLRCKKCSRLFGSVDQLNEHDTDVHPPGLYVCNTCCKEFMNLTSLEYHERYAHTDNRDYQCDKCGNQFKTERCLQKHEQRVHLKRFDHICEPCEKGFVYKSDLQKHQRTHHKLDGNEIDKNETELYACSDCSKVFPSRTQLSNHRRIVHAPKIFSCDICEKKFNQIRGLKSHKELVHPEKLYNCDECAAEFKNMKLLTNHKTAVHLGVFKHYCQECDIGFMYSQKLREHQRIQHDKIPFSCDKCGKTFGTGAGLWNHMEKHVDAEYSCPLCMKICKSRTQLKNHKRVCKQQDREKYVCERCGKEVLSKKSLQSHMNAHDGLKPYKCDICGEALASVGNLQVHKRIHTDEKPYACTFCEKRFRQKPPLTLHMRIHTGEMPYQCTVCTKKFIVKAALRNHKCRGPPAETDPTESE
ncbi:unnamed protein product [Acanthoscelides obtectus]|uniref:C2H2-type domain-containing protein n=1 Tax=Acanthoscelides obtectus TaxID=200917 RepID=A0A9P0LBC1_ACAOB|nr:unnamed protein product [Acanthoscelides obtectus]CAK1675660.1 Zinc finger protein 62 homolog [Acanthoscelides obtectus]